MVGAVAGLALLAGTASAQRITPFVGGGLATGIGDLGENTESGWIVFAGVDFPLGAYPGLTFGVTASYARVPYSGGFNESTSVPSFFGEVGYTIGANSPRLVKPYVRAGAGVQLQQYDGGDTGYPRNSNGGLAFSGGAGVQFAFSPATVVVGARLVSDGDAGVVGFHAGVAFPLHGARK